MPRNDRGVSTPIIIAVVLVVIAGIVATLIALQHHQASHPELARAPKRSLSAEERAYLSSFAFADFHVSAAVNYLGDTVTYLDGTVTNKGGKLVRRLEVELNFVDVVNQVVLRENANPLANHPAPLQPGETLAFRINFEHMPVDWNQAPPKARAVYVEF